MQPQTWYYAQTPHRLGSRPERIWAKVLESRQDGGETWFKVMFGIEVAQGVVWGRTWIPGESLNRFLWTIGVPPKTVHSEDLQMTALREAYNLLHSGQGILV